MRFNKFCTTLLVIVFACSVSFASVGVKEEGTMLGAATDINYVGTCITASGATGGKTVTTFPKSTIVTATPATLTTADTGTTYIIAANSLAYPQNTITTITLPKASSTTGNVSFRFITDGSGLVLKPHDDAADNIFIWSSDLGVYIVPVGRKQLRIKKSTALVVTTGATIEVVMGDGVWYVHSASPTTIDVETYSKRVAAYST